MASKSPRRRTPAAPPLALAAGTPPFNIAKLTPNLESAAAQFSFFFVSKL